MQTSSDFMYNFTFLDIAYLKPHNYYIMYLTQSQTVSNG